MSLKDIEFKLQYRSDIDNLDNDFYNICMKQSSSYDRASGYFTSSSLKQCSQGLEQFIRKDGTIRLIVSPKLEKQDIEAIEKGLNSKEKVIEEVLIRELSLTEENIKNHTLSILSWLIYKNKLQIKIAVLKKLKLGIYHEKFGVFTDEFGYKVAFTGSANETVGGYTNNFESIDVYVPENQREMQRIKLKEENFNNMWSNNTGDLEVLDFPEAAVKKLLQYMDYKNEINFADKLTSDTNPIYYCKSNKIAKPKYLSIRQYQKDAINSWIKNNGSGILEMATGTGKTITALYLISELYNKFNKLAIIIVCPYQHLVNQWNEEAKGFRMDSILCFGSREQWQLQLREEINNFNMGISSYISAITTNSTFCTENFQSMLKDIKQPVILVFDEAHHVGTINFQKYIPKNIRFRLGLSATPSRWFDDEGNKILENYFEGIVYKFSLENAIGEFLTPYFYYPHIVYFTDEECSEYYQLSSKIGKLLGYSSDGNNELSETVKMLLIKRSKLIGKAENKIIELKSCLSGRGNSRYNLFYTGDGKIGDERQIEKVIKMLGNELNMKVSSFTSCESKEERKKILESYASGNLQGLVAIKCLDEGVNVPLIQNAYILASSTNPREFIQRRGRVLRKHPDKKYSYIHDFIVIPKDIGSLPYSESNIFNVERNLMKKELLRVNEFCKTAINGPEALNMLLPLKKAYNLLDM
ncbi:DEAD/DEAH box helicase family protein [Clostridium sp. A1-XYC3]|uniref:DEAD/DEAH box helicase family protein n=1 Tax=Clostridium tanneri TaxID=3037988 RepID=A0ABU4JX27_9CLOT|nr:DEAD/DEAH box helicase family protein [Clostridium sp. A1-XYC3]MDW8802469.1 DEAD/DEAH box helicase family protein [Clostridium sp. A1-XYC3]